MSKIAEVLEQHDERLDVLEALIAKIEHNGGLPLDDDPPPPPKHKPVLIADRLVAERYDVVVRTIERWDQDPSMGFPPAIRIRRRRYRSLEALETWERQAAKAARRTQAVEVR